VNPEYPWRPVGELLVERGLLDEYELESLLQQHRLSTKLFGEFLVSKRVVSADDVAGVIAEQHGLHLDSAPRPSPPPESGVGPAAGERTWRPLGRILVEQGLLSESGLQRVLLSQQRQGALLGELLLERRYVTPEQLAGAIAIQHGLDVGKETLASARPLETAPPTVHYEVRVPGSPPGPPLHVSPTFLDASDFAFEILDEEDPEALEIVKANGDESCVAWSYARPEPA
jgi:hypothetical protein